MEFGLVGNCNYSALLHNGNVEWLCWPRMDSSFVFGALLDREKGGEFSIQAVDANRVEQSYILNTNVMKTRFYAPTGVFDLIDFAPRFLEHGRYYKPTMLIRTLRRVEGEPLVRVVCRPTYDYGRTEVTSWRSSNHIAFQGLPSPLRLTADVPLTAVEQGRPFSLSGERYVVLTWGQPLESDLVRTARSFLRRTIDYWRTWVKHCRVPRDYQDAVIRSALALKLHQFEDTGALLAATTTSLPEYPGAGRNWDYRYCWLRDAFFTLNAFERLGQFEEMERFLSYLRALCTSEARLQPVYGIDGEAELIEQQLPHLSGYRGEQPVRIGNQAYEHVQNDVYGELILAVSRMLLDRRFTFEDEGVVAILKRLIAIIEKCVEEPDAGLWELRGMQKVHGFSALMHWAGARKVAEVAEAVGGRPSTHEGFEGMGEALESDELEALRVRAERVEARAHKILESCWNEDIGALTQAVGEPNLDAAMLTAIQLGYFAKDPERARRHVEAIDKGLRLENSFLLRRYAVEDDFGYQKAAFTVCTFWLAEAMAMVGRKQDARRIFEKLLAHRNSLGLLSEDILPESGELAGNFPQTYCHVGVINTAFRLSRDWE